MSLIDAMRRGRFTSYFTVTLTALSITGCFTSSDDVVQTPGTSWTKRECMTVLLSAMAHNLHDNRMNIKVIVTPYIPRVIEAITRMDQLRDSLNIDSALYDMKYDALLKSSTGLLYDWDSGLLYSAAHQRYYHSITDLDSLLFLVTMINTGYPCIPPILVGGSSGSTRPLTLLSDWPCYTPDLTHLRDQIVLINDRGDTLRSKYVWGVKNTQLTSDEKMFIMFPFTVRGGEHFLARSESFTLSLTCVAPSIGYTFSIASLME